MKPQQSSPTWQADTDKRAACVKVRKKRREKMLDASDIRLLILHFLALGAAHGYELIKSIEDLSKGEYAPSPGIIYPNLTQLEEAGYIQVLDDRETRKAYALEEKGRLLLQEQHDDLLVILERLTSLAILVNNRSIPEVERAIHNMKTALNSRLSQENISQQSLHAIIDAMDEAAKKIERS
ncbi:PadR family transcriptional regulator [Gibbsiella quercinecans]|uniref:PadR family transcriptional regulator n=1 Tax=Gibbsiella quercinecans TaxID=929813 RepID=UPI003A4DAE23